MSIEGDSTAIGSDVGTRRHRRAWLVAGSVVAAVGVAFFGMWVASALARGTRTVQRRYMEPVSMVRVTGDSGDVVIVGDRGRSDGVEVRLRITDGLFGARVTSRLVGNDLTVAATCPPVWSIYCDVRVEIHAPRSTPISARTDNGDIVVRAVDGPVKLTSDNGDITATDAGGRLDMRTDNGDVVARALRSAMVSVTTDNGDVSLDFARSPSSVGVATNNGDVEVGLPDEVSVAYAVATDTDNGVATTRIRTDPTSRRHIAVTTDNGDIALRSRR